MTLHIPLAVFQVINTDNLNYDIIWICNSNFPSSSQRSFWCPYFSGKSAVLQTVLRTAHQDVDADSTATIPTNPTFAFAEQLG